MFPSPKQWNLCYIAICVIIGVYIIHLIFHREATVDQCGLHRDFVPVSLHQIMTGNPVILPQDSDKIIQYIWENQHLEPPSKHSYNLEDPNEDPSRGQGQFIRKIFNNITNGFFVECGALDGETRSNTLFMEQHLGWKGLLVEGDPSNYKLMQEKHRKSWISNTCLAVKPYPHHVEFLQKFNQGKILDSSADADSSSNANKETVTVQCMPLFSLLSAINVTTVDYFSLDVEGNELQVLKTIPFDKVMIKSLSVEYIHTEEGKDEIISFMESKGYEVVGVVRYPNNLANDLMLVHKSVKTLSA